MLGEKQKHKKPLAFNEKPIFRNQFIRKCKLKGNDIHVVPKKMR